MVSEINEALKSCAIKGQIKISKTSQHKQSNNNPWYDKECLDIKSNMENMAKRLKKEPFLNSTKEQLYILIYSTKRKSSINLILRAKTQNIFGNY